MKNLDYLHVDLPQKHNLIGKVKPEYFTFKTKIGRTLLSLTFPFKQSTNLILWIAQRKKKH